jgi:hypothetical protein
MARRWPEGSVKDSDELDRHEGRRVQDRNRGGLAFHRDIAEGCGFAGSVMSMRPTTPSGLSV